jgi:hypothetical protein
VSDRRRADDEGHGVETRHEPGKHDLAPRQERQPLGRARRARRRAGGDVHRGHEGRRGSRHKGSVALDGTTIVDYSADESSPECCPTTARRTAIAFGGGEFRVAQVGDVSIDQQPADLFAA